MVQCISPVAIATLEHAETSAPVSFIAPASTETAVVAGAGGATNVDGAAAGEGCKRLHSFATGPFLSAYFLDF